MDDFAPGTVWLVGAGPGDPELLTAKALRLIGRADVIFYDALVGPGVLKLAPARARMVPVGKRSGRHSQDQRAIGAMIVTAAHDGERVVRLKGGDPSIFGRAGEEIAACDAAGIAVRVCPGVTAASAATACLGRSLSLRGAARRVVFLTAHTRDGALDAVDWARLADPQASLVVYMGKAAAGRVSAGLIAAGLAAETPVALVENVSLPNERRFTTRLDLLPLAARTALGDGPALLLIGEAMRQGDSNPAETAAARVLSPTSAYGRPRRAGRCHGLSADSSA